MQESEYEFPRIHLLRTRVNKGKTERAEAIGPWPSKCCLSGAEFASYDLLTPDKNYWGYTGKTTCCLRALHTTEHR
jgi:hypothetical protein